MSLLEVGGIVMRFEGVVALDGPTFAVDEDGMCGLIGPNGAGKTTLFNCVSRLYTPQAAPSPSTVRTCSPTARDRRARHRAHVPEPRAVHGLTVRDNVMLGAHHRIRIRFRRIGALGARGAPRGARCAPGRRALERLGLADVADRPAGGLPYGTLKRVELARALCRAAAPALLDEPASGLTHGEVDELGELIVSLRATST